MAEAVEAIAVDTPVVGFRGKRVNTLRLWTARAFDPIRLDAFNAGDHAGALAGWQYLEWGGKETLNLHRQVEWSFCLMAARMAADQERR